jgi:hypothetical protein
MPAQDGMRLQRKSAALVQIASRLSADGEALASSTKVADAACARIRY